MINERPDRLALGQEITLAQLANAGGCFGGRVLALLALDLMGLPQRERFPHDLVLAAASAGRECRKAGFLIRRQAYFHSFRITLPPADFKEGLPSVALIERQRNPGAAFELNHRSRISLRSIRATRQCHPSNPSMRLRAHVRRHIAQHPVHFPGEALALVLRQRVDALFDVFFDGRPIVAVAPRRFRADGGEREKLTRRTFTRRTLTRQTRVIVHI